MTTALRASLLGAALVASAAFPLTAQAATATDLKLLQFNIWQEGTSVPNGFNKIVDTIVTTQPDVVFLSEVRNYNNVDFVKTLKAGLAKKGLTYVGGTLGGDADVISKYPIISQSNVTAYNVKTYTLNVNGQSVIVVPLHLDYTSYACYLPRGYNGGTPDWAMRDANQDGQPDPVTDIPTILNYNLASQRDEVIGAVSNWAKTISTPIIIGGDFNEPSDLDWTSATANLYGHSGTIVPWQTTKTLQAAGFSDSYRVLFPNPVTHPGFTWPSYADGVGTTSWTPKSDERDRIDFIFYKGTGLYAKRTTIVGPLKDYVKNVVNTENTLDPFTASTLAWPSDHKGVLSTISIPVKTNATTLVANKNSYTSSDANITLSYTASNGAAQDWIGIYSKGDTPGSIGSKKWAYVPTTAGSKNFTNDLPSGAYQAYIFSNNGYSQLAGPIDFEVGTATAFLTTSKALYSPTESIAVSYSTPETASQDWIGIYKAGERPSAQFPAKAWQYTPNTTTGTLNFNALPVGDYDVYYLARGGYSQYFGPTRVSVR